jgi:hypothetical protein
MERQTKTAVELLAIASRLWIFAREARDHFYSDKFCRGAESLEIEAVGYAASSTIAAALREERRMAKCVH